MKRSLFSRTVGTLGALGVIVPALLAVGCGGSDSNAPAPNAANSPPPGTTGYPPPGTTGYPPPGNTGYPPPANTGYPPPANTAPPPAAPPPGGATGTAQPLDPNLAGPASAALSVYARTEAPGMAADGPPVAGTFQEGQTLESAFTFQPGKCYTLVAAGAGPQQVEVEMQYTTPLPGLSPSIGKSTQAAAQASMGGKNNCMKPLSPFPAPAKYVLRVKKGAGIAAAQLYSK